MGSSKILLGALVGVAVGATLGILFAPDKGSCTRKKIADKGTEYADNVKEKFSSMVDHIINQFEKEREAVTEAVDQVERETYT